MTTPEPPFINSALVKQCKFGKEDQTKTKIDVKDYSAYVVWGIEGQIICD